MRGRKFGYHWIWMTPVGYVLLGAGWLDKKYHAWQHRRKIRKILKNNPDIKRLSTLSGIKE